jgi:hypothetical protein
MAAASSVRRRSVAASVASAAARSINGWAGPPPLRVTIRTR